MRVSCLTLRSGEANLRWATLSTARRRRLRTHAPRARHPPPARHRCSRGGRHPEHRARERLHVASRHCAAHRRPATERGRSPRIATAPNASQRSAPHAPLPRARARRAEQQAARGPPSSAPSPPPYGGAPMKHHAGLPLRGLRPSFVRRVPTAARRARERRPRALARARSLARRQASALPRRLAHEPSRDDAALRQRRGRLLRGEAFLREGEVLLGLGALCGGERRAHEARLERLDRLLRAEDLRREAA